MKLDKFTNFKASPHPLNKEGSHAFEELPVVLLFLLKFHCSASHLQLLH
jgi:hypothetical protein